MGKEQLELIEACREGNLERVQQILHGRRRPRTPLSFLKNGGCWLSSVKDPTTGYTPLHLAALHGYSDVAEYLLGHSGPDVQLLIAARDRRGCLPLHLAAWGGHPALTRLLLEADASGALVNTANNARESALHLAAQHGHSKVLTLLLQHQGDPAPRNARGESCLDLASRFGRYHSARLLISYSPELILQAAQLVEQCPTVVETHHNQSPPPSPAPSSTQSTANTFSTSSASASATSHTGKIPTASQQYSSNSPACSPLHLAARNGHTDVIRLLLDSGFDIDWITEEGSALHVAALFGKVDVVKYLLKRGIGREHRDWQGRTTVEVLREHESQRAVQDLTQLMQNRDAWSQCIQLIRQPDPFGNNREITPPARTIDAVHISNSTGKPSTDTSADVRSNDDSKQFGTGPYVNAANNKIMGQTNSSCLRERDESGHPADIYSNLMTKDSLLNQQQHHPAESSSSPVWQRLPPESHAVMAAAAAAAANRLKIENKTQPDHHHQQQEPQLPKKHGGAIVADDIIYYPPSMQATFLEGGIINESEPCSCAEGHQHGGGGTASTISLDSGPPSSLTVDLNALSSLSPTASTSTNPDWDGNECSAPPQQQRHRHVHQYNTTNTKKYSNTTTTNKLTATVAPTCTYQAPPLDEISGGAYQSLNTIKNTTTTAALGAGGYDNVRPANDDRQQQQPAWVRYDNVHSNHMAYDNAPQTATGHRRWEHNCAAHAAKQRPDDQFQNFPANNDKKVAISAINKTSSSPETSFLHGQIPKTEAELIDSLREMTPTSSVVVDELQAPPKPSRNSGGPSSRGDELNNKIDSVIVRLKNASDTCPTSGVVGYGRSPIPPPVSPKPRNYHGKKAAGGSGVEVEVINDNTSVHSLDVTSTTDSEDGGGGGMEVGRGNNKSQHRLAGKSQDERKGTKSLIDKTLEALEKSFSSAEDESSDHENVVNEQRKAKPGSTRVVSEGGQQPAPTNEMSPHHPTTTIVTTSPSRVTFADQKPSVNPTMPSSINDHRNRHSVNRDENVLPSVCQQQEIIMETSTSSSKEKTPTAEENGEEELDDDDPNSRAPLALPETMEDLGGSTTTTEGGDQQLSSPEHLPRSGNGSAAESQEILVDEYDGDLLTSEWSTPDEAPPSAMDSEAIIYHAILPISEKMKRVTTTSSNPLQSASSPAATSTAIPPPPAAAADVLFGTEPDDGSPMSIREEATQADAVSLSADSEELCSCTEDLSINSPIKTVPSRPPDPTTATTARKKSSIDSIDDKAETSKQQGDGLDESAEWAQINDMLASFGGAMCRESVFSEHYEPKVAVFLHNPKTQALTIQTNRDNRKSIEENKLFEMSSGSASSSSAARSGAMIYSPRPSAVETWLASLPSVTDPAALALTFERNGFDRTDFMEMCLDKKFLEEECQLRKQSETVSGILESVSQGGLPPWPAGTQLKDHRLVSDWLISLGCQDYIGNFMKAGLDTVIRVANVEWSDAMLKEALGIPLKGHRRRLLASLIGQPVAASAVIAHHVMTIHNSSDTATTSSSSTCPDDPSPRSINNHRNSPSPHQIRQNPRHHQSSSNSPEYPAAFRDTTTIPNHHHQDSSSPDNESRLAESQTQTPPLKRDHYDHFQQQTASSSSKTPPKQQATSPKTTTTTSTSNQHRNGNKHPTSNDAMVKSVYVVDNHSHLQHQTGRSQSKNNQQQANRRPTQPSSSSSASRPFSAPSQFQPFLSNQDYNSLFKKSDEIGDGREGDGVASSNNAENIVIIEDPKTSSSPPIVRNNNSNNQHRMQQQSHQPQNSEKNLPHSRIPKISVDSPEGSGEEDEEEEGQELDKAKEIVFSSSEEFDVKSPDDLEVVVEEVLDSTSSPSTSSPIAGGGGTTTTANLHQHPKWNHNPSELVHSSLGYSAHYLGSTLIDTFDGATGPKKAISKMKKNIKDIAKIPQIVLNISYRGVKISDAHTKRRLTEHAIHNIHCVCQDERDLNCFAYITKDSTRHFCHVFSVLTADLATEIILSLGQAFEVAYEMATRSSTTSSSHSITNPNPNNNNPTAVNR